MHAPFQDPGFRSAITMDECPCVLGEERTLALVAMMPA